MTVPAQDRFTFSSGNGVTTTFPYTFMIPGTVDDPQFLVYLIEIATGTRTDLTVDVDYSIAGLGVEAGGVVTYPLSGTPLASTHRIVIESNMPYEQQTDVYNSGTLYLNAIEDQFDNTTRQVQQIQDRVNRTFSVGIGYEGNYELFPVAGQLIGWDDTGTALENKQSESESAAAAYAAQLAAEAAQVAAEAAAAALPAISANTMLVDNPAGTARETKTDSEVRDFLGVWYKNSNYSMPNALDNLILYVMTTGSDTISDIANHGQEGYTPFLTLDAAVNYAKKYWEFHGRMTVLELRVGPGSWGNFATGSNLEQAYDGYPFGIFLTAQDAATPANWPEFDIISIGGFLNKSVYVKNVLAGVFGVTRMNILCVNDVKVKDVGSAYCLYASIKSQLHVFGDIEITEPVSYSSSFIYAQQQGSIALENGDAPLVFPMVNLINPGNITSPTKYRAVFGAFIYCPANIWPQLTYASTFYTDHTSFSSQTTTGTDAKYNSATGGGSVAWGGTSTTGYEWFADGRLHQWGTVVLTSLAAGYTAVAGTITFDTTVPFSAAPRVHLSCNNAYINVAKAAGGTAAVTQNVGAYNMSGSAQSTTVTWDAWGVM